MICAIADRDMPQEIVMAELEYGPVYVLRGRHKGRILYYDDDYTSKTAICYVGHPLSFCGTFDVALRFLREPTIDDLIKRREDSKISDGLESSQTMILFLSKKSVQSLWTRKEWQSFLTRQLSGSLLKILPVLIEECDVPAILSDIKYRDFRDRYYEGFKQIYEAVK